MSSNSSTQIGAALEVNDEVITVCKQQHETTIKRKSCCQILLLGENLEMKRFVVNHVTISIVNPGVSGYDFPLCQATEHLPYRQNPVTVIIAYLSTQTIARSSFFPYHTITSLNATRIRKHFSYIKWSFNSFKSIECNGCSLLWKITCFY